MAHLESKEIVKREHTLRLNQDELDTLVIVLGECAGDTEKSRRVISDNLYRVLSKSFTSSLGGLHFDRNVGPMFWKPNFVRSK